MHIRKKYTEGEKCYESLDKGWTVSYYYHYPLLGVSVIFLRALSEQRLKALIETTPFESSMQHASGCSQTGESTFLLMLCWSGREVP